MKKTIKHSENSLESRHDCHSPALGFDSPQSISDNKKSRKRQHSVKSYSVSSI